MLTALSILLDAVAYGMVLFTISIGLSIMMGLMRVVNLAHGRVRHDRGIHRILRAEDDG